MAGMGSVFDKKKQFKRKASIFRVITLCSPLKVIRRFGGSEDPEDGDDMFLRNVG
jgi:hypothetical protein